jgi:hypothetical protein
MRGFGFGLVGLMGLVLTLLILGLCVHVTFADHFQRVVGYFLGSVKPAFSQDCCDDVVDYNEPGDFIEGGFVLGHESEVVEGGFGDAFAMGGEVVHEFAQPAFFVYFLFQSAVEMGVGSGCFRKEST